jgi:hypothetical protein
MIPQPRFAHSVSVSPSHDDTLIVIGGVTTRNEHDNNVDSSPTPMLSDVATCVASNLAHWQTRRFDSSAFEARSAHAAALVGSRQVYVFGGRSPRGVALSDLAVLDTGSWRWRAAAVNQFTDNGDNDDGAPSARHGHVMVYDAKRRWLVVHGGFVPKQKARVNQFHAFDVESARWRTLMPRSGMVEPHMARSEHSAVLVGERLVCFGGNAAGYRHQLANDVFVYDIDANVCSMLQVRGKPPAPRRAHAACFVSVKTARDVPHNAADADADSLSYDVRQMFISGGFGHNTRFNDLWRLVWHGAAPPFWQRVDLKWALPRLRPRGFHGMVALRDRLVLIGGFDDVALDDVVELSLKCATDATPPAHVSAVSAADPAALQNIAVDRVCARCRCVLSYGLRWRQNASRASTCPSCHRRFCHKCAHTLVYVNASDAVVCSDCGLYDGVDGVHDNYGDDDDRDTRRGADSGDENDALSSLDDVDNNNNDDDDDDDEYDGDTGHSTDDVVRRDSEHLDDEPLVRNNKAVRGSVSVPKRDLASSWTVAQVGAWLTSIGLGQYRKAFADSSVDGDMLKEVSEQLLLKTIKMSRSIHRQSFQTAVTVLFDGGVEGDATVGAWSLDDVLAWLHAIELDSLIERFRDAAVHGAFLLLFDDGALDELGVDNVVHRFKLRTRLQQAIVEASIQRSSNGVGARDNERQMSVADVGVWLGDHGLTRYTQAFAECSVDGALLMLLDDEHIQFVFALAPAVAREPVGDAGMLIDVGALHLRSFALARAQLRRSATRAYQRALKMVRKTDEEVSSASRASSVSGAENAFRSDPKQWSVARVGRWLSKIRLPQLKALFYAGAVHGALLLHLRDDELETALGIANELHRIKIDKQIVALREQADHFQALVDSLESESAAGSRVGAIATASQRVAAAGDRAAATSTAITLLRNRLKS